jgi:IS6 family transposase
MARYNPFKHHRFPQEAILLAVRWYCRYPLSYRDIRDFLAERGITFDAATVYRRV